jgi:hypothetical protein
MNQRAITAEDLAWEEDENYIHLPKDSEEYRNKRFKLILRLGHMDQVDALSCAIRYFEEFEVDASELYKEYDNEIEKMNLFIKNYWSGIDW